MWKILVVLFFYSVFLINCQENEPTEIIHHKLAIINEYVSNGVDNYDNEIGVNFRFEWQNWFWYYEQGRRWKIYSNQHKIWRFTIPADYDGVYINARFFYLEFPEYPAVDADTTIHLNRDIIFKFWNCGDTTATEFPFSVCLTEIDTVLDFWDTFLN